MIAASWTVMVTMTTSKYILRIFVTCSHVMITFILTFNETMKSLS